MKVGLNGETFFFVNDFAGNPVGDMQIRAVLNDFVSHSAIYSEEGRKINLISPLDKKVFSGEVTLGKTDKNGILKTELLEEYFESLNKAQEAIAVAISTYNHLRPHNSIGNLTPFEAHSLKSREIPKRLWKNYYQPKTKEVAMEDV